MENGLLVVCKQLGEVTLFAPASGTKATGAFAKQHGVRNLGSANNVNAHFFQDFTNAAKVAANKLKLFFLCVNCIATIHALAHIV